MSAMEIVDDILEKLKGVFFDPYNFCPKKYFEIYTMVYRHLSDCRTFSDSKTPTGSLPQIMYSRLKEFLKNTLDILQKRSEGLEGVELIKFYFHIGENVRVSLGKTNAMFLFLNKIIVREIEYGRLGFYEISQHCDMSWIEDFFRPYSKRLNQMVLGLIEKNRNGEPINYSLIRNAMSIYLEMKENDFLKSSYFKIYKEELEPQLLKDTQDFYQRKSNNFLQDHSVTEYIKQVEKWLMEECTCLEKYFHHSTMELVYPLVLVKDHLPLILSRFQQCLSEGNSNELASILYILSKTSNLSMEFHSACVNHIRDEGLSELEKCGESAVSDANCYFSAILKVHRKYSGCVKETLPDESYVKALDEACKSFINNNSITKQPKCSGKTIEHLAQFSDGLLKKNYSLPEESDLEDELDKLIIIIKYLDDPYVFQNVYKKMLARRLLQNNSVSPEAEASMISRLKDVFGSVYTVNLERMLNDHGSSKELGEDFREHLKKSGESLSFDLEVNVLTSCTWPSQKWDNCTSLPCELATCVTKFNQFYLSSHQGKRLQWVNNISRGELQANCFSNVYTFQVSTFQMTILLQFNSLESFTVQELHENTEINLSLLRPILQILLRAKLLKSNDDDLSFTSIVSLNLRYNNKKRRVNINVPIKPEFKEELKESKEQVNRERRYLIESAIVCIMKSHKILDHQQLVAEVIKELSSKFKVDMALLKICINSLLDRKYLEKTTALNKYQYVP